MNLADPVSALRARRFHVICVGEAELVVGRNGLRPGGGAVQAALALARSGLGVGLAASVAHDLNVESLRAAGIDVDGVLFGESSVLLNAGDAPIVVPDVWSSKLLLISGVSASLSRAASLCRAARAARRAGALVVVDVNARPHAWTGQDSRAIHALLREADVVRCSTADMIALWMDRGSLRSSMRDDAVLLTTDGPGAARARGMFGEVAVPATYGARTPGCGDVFTAAVVTDLARGHDPRLDARAFWEATLRRAHRATYA